MDYKVEPLAIPQVNWQAFIDVAQPVIGESPTRGIDASPLDLRDAAAFLGLLNFENKPIENLRHPNSSYKHYATSFICQVDEVVLIQLQSQTSLKVLAREGRRKYVAILTGSMDEWVDAILNACTKTSPSELRGLLNQVVIHFERAGFREIFNRYRKLGLADGTFAFQDC